jgi:hypothetical protein
VGAKSGDSSLFVYGVLMRGVQVRELLGRNAASTPARLASYERGRAGELLGVLANRMGAGRIGALTHAATA